MDHPLVGGRFTVFVLCYGEYVELAKSCLDSILSTLPTERLDLRVGLNAVCEATRAYVKGLPTTKIYEDPSNAGKYVMMRRMFHDPECPITTTHLVWFDEDTRIVEGSIWQRLAEAIVVNHPHGTRVYGLTMLHDVTEYARAGYDPIRWFREATWWRGKDMLVGPGPQTAPDGTFIRFVVGWFWCMATEMITAADIPDVRLVHNGGDIACGEAVRQAGATLQPLNVGKEYVWHPSNRRRGKATRLPWSPPAEWLRNAAGQGNSAAQHLLGTMCYRGQGMPQNYAEAAEWWRKAADQGHGGAQNKLGRLYAAGQGVVQDFAEAAKWYRAAADRGYAAAQYNLGVLYENGRGVPRSDTEAARWYRKAAVAGDRGAQNNLGILHAKGQGVPQDYVQAFTWLSLAAVQDDANAAKNRDVVAARMTPAQLEQAKALVAAWQPSTGPEPRPSDRPGARPLLS
jgi:hypothetical protein